VTQPEDPGNIPHPAAGAGPGRDPWNPRNTPPRTGLIVVALVAGITGLAASVLGVAAALLPRQFTAGQAQQIMAWETGKRWRTWPAGEVFPAALGYQLPGGSLGANSGLGLTAHRDGIGPQESCAAATDRAAGRVLDQHGCTALLRATYTDATGAFVTTVGIAVLPSPRASGQARDALTAAGSAAKGAPPPMSAGQGQGVRALAVRGTLAAGFSDAQRQISSVVAAGPYLIMYGTGYADGRPREQLQPGQYAEDELVSVSVGIANSIASRISARPPIPHCPGAPGC
jgi:hypothetical protein